MLICLEEYRNTKGGENAKIYARSRCCIMRFLFLPDVNHLFRKILFFPFDDLSGKKIGVQLGTTGDTLVSDYEEDGSGTVVERYNKGNDAILALKQGKIDAVVIDVQPAQSFVKTNSELMILTDIIVNDFIKSAVCFNYI